jgi:hypothetical protein
MTPRRSTRIAAAAELACTALAPLPQPLVLHILELVPPRSRARCACVCRAWRAAVADESLWLRLDLTREGDPPHFAVTDAVLRGAAARARGRLCALDVRFCDDVSYDAVLAVAAANAGSLRELWYDGCEVTDDVSGSPYVGWRALTCEQLEALVRAAPALNALHVGVNCDYVAEARRALPLGPLQSCNLTVNCRAADEAQLSALAADMSRPGALKELVLNSADLRAAPAALDAIVDAVLAVRTLEALWLETSHPQPLQRWLACCAAAR